MCWSAESIVVHGKSSLGVKIRSCVWRVNNHLLYIHYIKWLGLTIEIINQSRTRFRSHDSYRQKISHSMVRHRTVDGQSRLWHDRTPRASVGQSSKDRPSDTNHTCCGRSYDRYCLYWPLADHRLNRFLERDDQTLLTPANHQKRIYTQTSIDDHLSSDGQMLGSSDVFIGFHKEGKYFFWPLYCLHKGLGPNYRYIVSPMVKTDILAEGHDPMAL